MSLRHLAKFACVGLMGNLINLIIFSLLHLLGLVLFICAVIAFLIANINGFFWHRHWTFVKEHKESAKTQYVKYITISLTALSVNLLALSMLSGLAPVLLAQVMALQIASVINIAGNRLWAFKKVSYAT